VVHGFVFGQEHANLFGWQGGRKILIGIDIDVIELKTRIAEKLMSARRFGRQQQFWE
jgi:phosphotransferase system IIA component